MTYEAPVSLLARSRSVHSAWGVGEVGGMDNDYELV